LRSVAELPWQTPRWFRHLNSCSRSTDAP